MPIAKVKILDEVNCVIVGLKPDHALYFWNEFGRYAPNYFFNPKFKIGQWDGKIRYFSKTGKTYVYLLEDIIPMLSGLGYSISLEDNRTSVLPSVPQIDKNFFNHIFHPDFNENIVLRDHQVEAVNTVTQDPGIIIAGTGAGKTLICAALCTLYGEQGLTSCTIVPSKDLIEQTYTEYDICQLDAGRYYGEKKELNHQHIVSTWQSLKNNPGLMEQFNMIIVDETHGAKGQMLQRLLVEHGAHIPLRFGLTGTLPKAETDAMAVRIGVGDVKYTITAKQLMDQGHLAKLDIEILQLEEDFDKEYKEYLESNPIDKKTLIQFKDSYFPDYQAEKRYLQSNNERIDAIAEYIMLKRDEKKGNVFCLVDGVRFGKKLAEAIDGAVFVHGKDKQKARQEVYELFKENDNLVVIATVHIASTGLSINRIFNMMFIDVGKSFVRVIQTIGRGLRKAKDKDHVLVTDICSDLKYGKRHLAERVKFYREAQYPHKKKKLRYSDVNI